MDGPDYEAFFRAYTQAHERSLGDSVDVAAIRGILENHDQVRVFYRVRPAGLNTSA